MTAGKRELLDLYEARGDEAAFVEARRLYEQELQGAEDARVRVDYGYLLECHGRNALREAVRQYERAIELDPDSDKPRYQLIAARAALSEPEAEIARYEPLLAGSPTDVRFSRLLAGAYLAARRFADAGCVVDDGLGVTPDDWLLFELRGEVRAATGNPDGALADWRRAVELEPETIGGLYSSAFLLEREGRLVEAIEAWRSIIDWSDARGNALDAEWPRRELRRLERER